MMATSPKNKTQKDGDISTALVKEFLDNQTKEMEIRVQELTLQKQQDDYGFEYVKMVLAAKVEDRKSTRNHIIKSKIFTYFFATTIILIIVGVIVYAMHSGNEDIAMEIIKAIIYLAGGGLGGYGVAKIRETTSMHSEINK